MDLEVDNITCYGCFFIFIVLFVLVMILITTIPTDDVSIRGRWIIKIYNVLNMSVLHITISLCINESRKNPAERKTYKTKGIRYKIDKIERIVGTTVGIWLWIMIFCLDAWSIISGNEMWALWHIIRQIITIPIACFWAFIGVLKIIEKADSEEREDNGDET